jgi:hypothetical protein
MTAVAVRKKVPKKPVKVKSNGKKNGKHHPMHPVSHAQYIREDRQPSALMEFIVSLEGELEYLDALREFQEEWCDHPKTRQEVASTLYVPGEDKYEHSLKCLECGVLRKRSGRAPSGRS